MIANIKRAAALFGAVILAAALSAAPAMAQDTPHLMLTLKDGVVDIELLKDTAPKHVEQIIKLTEAGAYDGVVFHRVIDGFMAQTGDVRNGNSTNAQFNMALAGTGDSDLPNVVAEFSDIPYERGVIGAARTNDPNSFNSQFFIMFTEYPSLNGQYTVFGRVVSGMEFVDNIAKGEPPANPDKIISAKIEYK
jgi:cyclophilin family peptidyl-prolyl cis-trans isomerase